MKLKKAEFGHEIQVGDYIQSKDGFNGTVRRAVTRTTKRYAFVPYNDVAEGKYPRVYEHFFQSLPRHPYSTVHYSVWVKA